MIVSKFFLVWNISKSKKQQHLKKDLYLANNAHFNLFLSKVLEISYKHQTLPNDFNVINLKYWFNFESIGKRD